MDTTAPTSSPSFCPLDGWPSLEAYLNRGAAYGTPLPPPAILANAYQQVYEQEHIVIDLTPPTPSTPPLILREDLFDVQVISQEEFLASLPGWNPVPLNRR